MSGLEYLLNLCDCDSALFNGYFCCIPDQVGDQGQRPGPPGFPPMGIMSERPTRVQGQGFGGSPGPLQRRDRVDHSKHQTSKLGHHADGTWDPNKRRPSSDAGES